MWISLISFSLVLLLLACLAMMIRLIRDGRNRDDSVGAGVRRRPLLFGSLTAALAGILPCSAPAAKSSCGFLRHAGHYHRHALDEFLALRNTLVVGWVLLAATALVVITDPGDGRALPICVAGLIVAVLLYTLPRLFLEVIGNNRVRRIEESLPDALDMATMCMSGGVPLQSALVRVSDEMQSIHPDLAFELRVMGRQWRPHPWIWPSGSSPRGSTPPRSSPGGDPWADRTARVRRGRGVRAVFRQRAAESRQRSEEAGNKTAIKLLFPLIFCLAPARLLMLLAPAAVELTDFVKRERQPGGAFSSASVESVTPLLKGSSGMPPQPSREAQGPWRDARIARSRDSSVTPAKPSSSPSWKGAKPFPLSLRERVGVRERGVILRICKTISWQV